MAKLPSKIWSIHFVNEDWESTWATAYGKLEEGYKWVVDSRLNFMLYDKKPWQRYRKAGCKDCMDNMYVLDLAHSLIGAKTVYVLVWFDVENHRLVPLYCELV